MPGDRAARGLARAARLLVGVGLGALTAVAACLVLLLALLPALRSGPTWAADLERRRLRHWLGQPVPPLRHAGRYLAARIPLGLLGGAVLVTLAVGAAYAGSLLLAAVTGGAAPGVEAAAGEITWSIIAAYTLPGLVLLFLNLSGLAGVARLEVALARLFAAPSRAELGQRVQALTASRAEVVAAVDRERRRIERDLHDGVQQRTVALGLVLSRAERALHHDQPDEATLLLRRGGEQVQLLLDDLREVSRRIYPVTLDRDGLAVALHSLGEGAPVPVQVTTAPTGPLDGAVQTAAWFTACEAITNAVKHAEASLISVELVRHGPRLVLTVHDDGRGGADGQGGGLAGLASRAAALDGRLTVHSPAGGGTTVRLEVPCG